MDRSSPKGEGKRTKTWEVSRVPSMEEFLAEAWSETSVAVSSCLGQKVIAEAALEEEEDDEEEENPDTHFKRKCKSPPPGGYPRKKKKTVRPSSRRCGTLQIKEVEASAAYVPHLAPPVTEPSVGKAPWKFVSVTGNIISFHFSTCFRD